MTVVNKPIIASAYISFPIQPKKHKILQKNLLMEELPAKENKIINNEIAKRGCFFEIPDKSEMFSLYCPSFFSKYKQENAPIFIITYIEIYTIAL